MNTHLHSDQTTRLFLHTRKHVEALARHLFKNDPIGLQKVDHVFGENTIVKPEILPVKPQNFTMHHIPQ